MSRRRPSNPLPILLVLALVPALGLWGAWRWTADQAAATDDAPPATSIPAPPAEPALSTGLMSVRRAAAQLSIDLNLQAFQEAAEPLRAAVGERSCMAMSLNGQVVASKQADRAVIPASNQKILVAAVALDVLGADFRYRTRLVGPEPDGGVIRGDVYLVGGGDPLLSGEWYPESSLDRFPPFNTTSIDDLARQLADAGVERIEGAVLGDGSRYDDEYFVPGWGGGVAGIEAGPYDALLVNDARVRNDDQRGSDPSEAGAREFVRILSEQGIAVTGGPGTGTAPAEASELASVSSMRLPEIIAEMLTNSDNNTAELMVKEIGYAAADNGTRQAGLEVMANTIERWGVPTDQMVLDDGSGLSLENRVSCATMLGVLDYWGQASPIGAGLSIAGETGTLSTAFGDTSVSGRMRAKTGTLNNPPFDQDPPAVKTLSGYLPVDGDQISFSLMLNGSMISDQRNYRPVWAELLRAITSYPAVASPAALGPR